MSSRPQLHDIESRLAARFTAIVVAVLVLGTVAFAVIDTVAATRRLDATLQQRAEKIVQRLSRSKGGGGLQAEARVVAADGRVISAGEQAAGIEAGGPADGFGYVEADGGRVRVYAVPLGNGTSLQLIDSTRRDIVDVLERSLELLAIALVVAAATFMLGRRFARKVLAPVHETVARLERYTADAGHELRTPLASASASLEVAEKTGDWAGGVQRARIEIDHASALIDRLLELTRVDAATLRLERIVPAEVAERVAKACAPAALARGVRVDRRGTGDDLTADVVLLEQLLTNLVTNAVRFADPGSTVTIQLGGGLIEVHDTGAVIPARELERIFEPFYQSDTSRSGDGSGLGLAIASAIAQAHGWSLSAASSEKTGTTFAIQTRPPRSR